jgi:hypothetical protein
MPCRTAGRPPAAPGRPLEPGRQQRLDQRPQAVVHDPRPNTHTIPNGRTVTPITPDQHTSTSWMLRLLSGVTYSAYPPLQALQAQETARFYDQVLVATIVPLVPGPLERLRAGIDVLDVGTGQGTRLSCWREPSLPAASTAWTRGTDDAGVAQQAAEEAQDLLSRLRSRPTLYELATNPLLLTMIAHVHHYRGALPGSRAGVSGQPQVRALRGHPKRGWSPAQGPWGPAGHP